MFYIRLTSPRLDDQGWMFIKPATTEQDIKTAIAVKLSTFGITAAHQMQFRDRHGSPASPLYQNLTGDTLFNVMVSAPLANVRFQTPPPGYSTLYQILIDPKNTLASHLLALDMMKTANIDQQPAPAVPPQGLAAADINFPGTLARSSPAGAEHHFNLSKIFHIDICL